MASSLRDQQAASTASDDAVTQDADQSMAADLEAVREARGWTSTQLKRYQAAEAGLDSVTDLLSQSHPDSVVGSVIPTDPTETPRVYVEGSAPEEVAELAELLGVAIVDRQPFSLDDLDARLATVHKAVLGAGLGEVVVSADIQREGAITLVIPTSEDAKARLAIAGIPDEIAHDVTIIASEEPIVEDQGAFGGMQLLDGGVFACTSGFTVRKIANGVTGVTGAGHCTGIDQIVHPGHGVHTAVQQALHVGEWGDVGWYTTGWIEADDFYADEFNNVRDVANVEPRANISIGEAICVFGRGSNHRDCTLDVENPNVFCGIGPQKLVQMNGDVTVGGDSGGGWTFANTAYGGTKGNCFSHSSFSVADLFDEALGVVVATT